MDLDAADIVGVGLELAHLLHGVVVVDAEAHVVGCGEEPLLSGNELGAPDWELRELEGLDAGSGLVVPDHDDASVQGAQGPWLGRVDVHRLDPLGRRRELLLDIEAKGHFEDSWMIKISRDRALGATVSRATMAGRGGGRRGSGG